MRAITFIFFFFLFIDLTFGQELEWNVNLHGFADNQEFSKSNFASPTIFGIRFAPEVGLMIDGKHRIRIGINSLNEFGDKHSFVRKIDPVIYYHYHQEKINFLLGSFPRYQRLDDYPKALMREDLTYYRPNIEGFMFKFKKKNFQQEVWVDWTSKQSDVDKEGFIIGVSGTVKRNKAYLSHYFTLWHNALTSSGNPEEHVQDNAAFVAQLGFDLSHKTFLDSLDIHVGGMLSLDRLRSVYDWRAPKGVLFGAYLGYRSFYIQDEWYIGESQYVGYGDSFYQYKRYNRLDLGWNAFKNRYLEARLSVSFHFAGATMSNQQQISLRYNIGGKVPLKSRESKAIHSLY